MILPCTPSASSFIWRCVDNIVSFSADGDTWLPVGSPSDVDGPFARVYDRAFEPGPLSWRTIHGEYERETAEWFRDTKAHRWVPGNVQDSHDSAEFKRASRLDDERIELHMLGLVGSATGQKLDAQRWRMLSPNAVLHPMFGPGVTVATDGSRVILFSFARFGTDWFMSHRTNIIGPVTSTPTRISDWDYSSNSTAVASARTAQKTLRVEKQKSIALELLASLLQK